MRDFREVADRYELLGVCKDIVAGVRAAVAQWPGFAAEAGVPQALAEDIAQVFAVR